MISSDLSYLLRTCSIRSSSRWNPIAITMSGTLPIQTAEVRWSSSACSYDKSIFSKFGSTSTFVLLPTATKCSLSRRSRGWSKIQLAHAEDGKPLASDSTLTKFACEIFILGVEANARREYTANWKVPDLFMFPREKYFPILASAAGQVRKAPHR